MRKTSCGVALLVVAGFVAAAQPDETPGVSENSLIETLASGGETAERAANWLGRRESIAGLKALIALGDEELIYQYVRGVPGPYGFAPEKYPYVRAQLGPELESLVVRHLDDERIGQAMLGLATVRKYATRELFEALLRHARNRDGPLAYDAVAALTNTDLPDIEPALLKLLARLEPQRRRKLLDFWRDRAFPPVALAVLKPLALQETAPTAGAALYQSGPEFYPYIARIGTRDAAAFLMGEFSRKTGDATEAEEKRRESRLIHALSRLPAEVPLPVDRIVASLRFKQEELTASPYIALLKDRRAEAGIDDLLAYLAHPKVDYLALFALRNMESPQSWMRIRAGLKRLLDEGRMTSRREQYERFYLDLGDPASYRRRQAQLFAQLEHERRRKALESQYDRPLEALKVFDAGRYAEVKQRYDEARDRLQREYWEGSVVEIRAAPASTKR